MSIKTKILIPTIFITVLIAASISTVLIILFSKYVDNSLAVDVDIASNVLADTLDSMKNEAQISAMLIANDGEIINATEVGDRSRLIKRSVELQKEIGVEFCVVSDGSGNVFYRTNQPDLYGDSVLQQYSMQMALSGESGNNIEKGTVARMAVHGCAPIYDPEKKIIGAIAVGYRLDSEEFVDKMKAAVGTEFTIFDSDERVATTVVKDNGTRAVGTKATDVFQEVQRGKEYVGRVKILDRDAIAQYSPIVAADGTVLGMTFAGIYLAEKSAAVANFLKSGAIVFSILIVIMLIIIVTVINKATAPIKVMLETADKLSVGDIDVTVSVNTGDEMNKLADSFNEMIDNIKEQAVIVENIAQGDLSVEVPVRSPNDVINNALSRMLATNNQVFTQIVKTAGQVADGSRQIAAGAYSLAQGANEQSMAIDQLSVSITQVARNTEDNSGIAMQAVELANKIKINAEKGSRQMNDMMTAVKDISEASQSINRVIKIIEDIAFQTNILSLNAAVEATHAGEHGKGFAVVAEEVRSLAARCSGAVKETAALIEDTMEKAELGERMAHETAFSLSEIVSGINNNERLINKIAVSSEEQNKAIHQINLDIDRVVGVVQENSAAAEESAATSEEMNSQSVVLTEMVSRFKLR